MIEWQNVVDLVFLGLFFVVVNCFGGKQGHTFLIYSLF